MSAPTPSKPRLRKLLVKYYQENDPVILNQGFDINGLVNFTAEKGIDVVNNMLFKKYGKAIDPDEDTGTALQGFNRMSQAFNTSSTVIVKKEQEFRQKLYLYFQKHDPAFTTQARAQAFEKFVKFAMLNGLEKLSDKLRAKYNAPIAGIAVTAEQDQTDDSEQMDVDIDDAQFGNNGLNPFNLDVSRLRDDLAFFYTQNEDEEQLEVLDQLTDWACEIGVDALNKNLQQIYGQTLNEVLEENNRPIHFNKDKPAQESTVEEVRALPPEPVAEPVVEPVKQEAQVNHEIVEEVKIVQTALPFEEMSDEELLEELRLFYERHDPKNIENLSRVLQVARKMGRNKLNLQLKEIYEDTLQPLPRREVVQRRISNAIPEPQENVVVQPVAVERSVPDVPSNDITMPTKREMPTFGQGPPPPNPKFGAPQGSQDLMTSLDHAVRGAGGVSVENIETQLSKKKFEEDEEDEDLPLFVRMARAKKKRIEGGKAIMRDADGTVHEVNILIDVCKNYEVDPLEGVCKRCGFAKSDHI